jgi:hypothetical protein
MIVCKRSLRKCVDCTEAKYTLGWRISKQFRDFFLNADEEDWEDKEDASVLKKYSKKMRKMVNNPLHPPNPLYPRSQNHK